MNATNKIKPEFGNIYFFDKKTKKTKSKFDKISRDFRYILRANNPNKSLSVKARSLVTNYYDMICKTSNKIIFVSHAFISSITEVGNNQNKNLHNELREIFNIQYHKSIMIEGKKYRDGFTVEFTKNTQIILKNPRLFYSSQTAENCHLSDKKLAVERQKIDTSLYIDLEHPLEEIKEEEPKGYSSSFISTKEPHQKNLTLATSFPTELAKVSTKKEGKQDMKSEQPEINSTILKSFGEVRGQEILKICTITKSSESGVGVQIKQGESLHENDKDLLRSCIKTAYGNDIHIVQKPAQHETRRNLWKEFENGMKEQFKLNHTKHAEHMMNQWFDKLKRTQSCDKLLLQGSNSMIDYILNNFESLIDTTAKTKKINIELIYEMQGRGYENILFTPNGRKI